MSTLTITRVAHSTVLIDFDGVRVLTDPWFSVKWGYYHGEPYGIALADLPHLDGVLVSHGHYDHYDMEAFKAYPDKAVPFLVKRGIAAKARAAGFTNVAELDAWETAALGPISVTAAPAKHAVPEITYMLQANGHTLYFGGDTLFIPPLHELAERFPRVDVAILAVNGLRIRPLLNWQVVMNPREAAELCAILRPRYAVPAHYAFTGGAFHNHFVVKRDGTPEQFAQAAAQLAPTTAVRILPPGQPLVVTDGQAVADPTSIALVSNAASMRQQ